MNKQKFYNFILKQHLHCFVSLLVNFAHFINNICVFFGAYQIWDLTHAKQVIQILKIYVTLVLQNKTIKQMDLIKFKLHTCSSENSTTIFWSEVPLRISNSLISSRHRVSVKFLLMSGCKIFYRIVI